jgi:hypothetical protein
MAVDAISKQDDSIGWDFPHFLQQTEGWLHLEVG